MVSYWDLRTDLRHRAYIPSLRLDSFIQSKTTKMFINIEPAVRWEVLEPPVEESPDDRWNNRTGGTGKCILQTGITPIRTREPVGPLVSHRLLLRC